MTKIGSGSALDPDVSMESGLEGRNNTHNLLKGKAVVRSLNGVRPRRPEQCHGSARPLRGTPLVSMESGLEGRNNPCASPVGAPHLLGLNGVRPRRPEQYDTYSGRKLDPGYVSMESGLEGRNNLFGALPQERHAEVSMESGLEGRNNQPLAFWNPTRDVWVSMESGLEGRNNRSRLQRPETVLGGLNGVRPRRPEQWLLTRPCGNRRTPRLNGVRPRRPEQSRRFWPT